MLPAAVFPMHDPEGLFFPHLECIKPWLKQVFEHTCISIPQDTRDRQGQPVARLCEDEFFRVIDVPAGLQIGEHFHALYQAAAQSAPPHQILHLCYIDRVAFALCGSFRDRFIADIQATGESDVPLIFHRSPAAWDTHPRNYFEIESMATRAGEMVFGKTLDFGWCHLALQARDLLAALQSSTRQDLSMVAEIVIALESRIHTREVDWLAWEDPFILNQEPAALKCAREASLPEVHKRLSYVVPILDLIGQSAKKRSIQTSFVENHTNE